MERHTETKVKALEPETLPPAPPSSTNTAEAEIPATARQTIAAVLAHQVREIADQDAAKLA